MSTSVLEFKEDAQGQKWENYWKVRSRKKKNKKLVNSEEQDWKKRFPDTLLRIGLEVPMPIFIDC